MSETHSTLLYGGVTALVVGLSIFGWRRSRGGRTYPPGPPAHPLLGNLKDIPTGGSEWLAYEQLGKRIGSDVIYMTALGSHLLVLNSFEAARDLLDKKGSLYSSRPRLVMIKEMMGWDWNLILMSYGKLFTAYRRVVQQEFSAPVVADRYRPVITREVHNMLGQLLRAPEGLVKHLKTMAGAVIMMVTYGHQVTSMDDEFVKLAEQVREHGEKTPGSNIVDIFPFMKYIPAWFPGAGFKREAMLKYRLAMEMRTAPYAEVMSRMAAGTAVPCMVSRLMQEDLPNENVDKGEFVKNCGGVVYSAGADTTVAALANFFLAMTLYPDVQARAQKELDEVITRDRLPTFEDRQRLPYLNNVVKESLRWKPVAPLAVPHSSIEDDEYRGGYIPKDTTVLPNIYAMLHDEAHYKNPNEFDPDRYLPTSDNPEGEPDPSRAAFGFGRRICPGRFFADDSLFLTISSALHVFSIKKPDGSKGVESVTWSSGLVSLPSPFPFAIVPRFAGAPDLLNVSEPV
ncbi:cytochrome P450 [Punctularia strigosozonata HHB-11173 SS5]|uniref:cytochrome P450 n=1 Tax=Punctularia strigosozonata (strain HHB-11173) TaxID=741275 RepID=UPI0004416F53|nr:cytochrome P450 [Punctularia strigosozonata HHB-11173 SS5]EIN09176.1 cytochrome P450 [Punctularia strigosozonata HHB-11173 SS5]